MQPYPLLVPGSGLNRLRRRFDRGPGWGQPLLAAESPDVGAAAAAYRRPQASQLKAEAGQSRIRDLYTGRAVAQKEVVNAEAMLAQAKSAVEQAKTTGEEALQRLRIFNLKPDNSVQAVTVRTPLPGKVLDIAVSAGKYRTDTNAPSSQSLTLATSSWPPMCPSVSSGCFPWERPEVFEKKSRRWAGTHTKLCSSSLLHSSATARAPGARWIVISP